VRPRFVPMSFTAVSVTHWWVLGAVPCGARDCLGIKTTTDGGASFQSLPAPPGMFSPAWNSPPAESFIGFANPEDGWVFDPGLYATHDGGLHWTAISMPGLVLELAPGMGEVYAVVSAPVRRCQVAGTCSTPPNRLWRTRPSSNDWAVDRAASGVSFSLAVRGASVWVVNAEGTRLLHSADAGRTFALEPQPLTGVFCSYSPVSNSFLWAYCSGGHFMFPYVSTDGGAHFTSVGTEVARITPVGYPNGSELVAASATSAVAASSVSDGPPGIPLIRTIDEGARWQVVQAAPSSNGLWSLIGFTTPEVGYALWQNFSGGYGTAQLWRTTDGGATWTRVKAVN
jgi:photosystem II stability/assembly factor-like uncharacterized protein